MLCNIWCLVFKIHVLRRAVMMINSVLLGLLETQYTARVSCDQMIKDYTHNEYLACCYTCGTCNSQAAWKYRLCYPGWHHPNANVFQQLEQHLWGTGSVTYIEQMNADHPWTVHTTANEDIIVAAMERKSRIRWDYSNWGSSKYFISISCIHTTICRVHICLKAIILPYSSVNIYDINTLWVSSFYITFYGLTKHILCMMVCSMLTTMPPLGMG
jgi:hypothetical protein